MKTPLIIEPGPGRMTLALIEAPPDLHPKSKRLVEVHVCVALVACPVCNAKIGELCVGRMGWRWKGTHADRRTAARGKTFKAKKVTQIIYLENDK